MSAQPQAQLDRRTERRAILLIYSAAFSYQLTLGLIQVLVPLYALHLGYDLTLLGVIVASQAVFGLMLRLFAGAIADQFGERWVLWASFVTMVAGMVLFVVSGVFWMLILAQSFVGYSRATYWTATQSYVSRINPERSGEVYGRLNGAGNAGGLIGAFLSGVLVATLGYGAAFGITGAVALAGFLGSIALPPLAARPTRRGFREPLGQIPGIARHRGMGLGGFAAFAASTAMILPSVLFIPYLRELDYSEAVTGGMQAISVGSSIAVGIVFGHILGRLGRRWTYTIAMVMAGTDGARHIGGRGGIRHARAAHAALRTVQGVGQHPVSHLGVRPQRHEPAGDGDGLRGAVLGNGAARRAGRVRRTGRRCGPSGKPLGGGRALPCRGGVLPHALSLVRARRGAHLRRAPLTQPAC